MKIRLSNIKKIINHVRNYIANALVTKILKDIEYYGIFKQKEYCDRLLKVSGNLAERFHEKDSGEYDELREKFCWWILCELKDIFKNK